MARNQSINQSINRRRTRSGYESSSTTVDYPGIKGKQKLKQCRYGNIRRLKLELTKETVYQRKRREAE